MQCSYIAGIISWMPHAKVLFHESKVRIGESISVQNSSVVRDCHELPWNGFAAVRQSGKRVIRIPDSVSNWAMVMNVSRSSLHRELKKMETDGVIKYVP